jgi:hypothetical protein
MVSEAGRGFRGIEGRPLFKRDNVTEFQWQPGSLANLITIIAGVMTIFGIGGLVSWSIFHRDRSGLAEHVVQICSYSLKVFLCLFGLISCGWPAGLVHQFVMTIVGGELGWPQQPVWWDSQHLLFFW